jgi:hypothetical protein
MPSSSTVTVQAGLSAGVNVSSTATDNLTNYSPQYNNQLTVNFASGTGVKKVNKACQRLCVIPPSGTDSFNLNTGAVSGSETDTLACPIGSSNSFTTTGLNILSVKMAAGGSQSISLFAGSANGFGGPAGTSNTININGSDSTGVGGEFRAFRSDSVGWGCSTAACNMVIKNLDGANASTFTLTLAGQ